MNLRSIIKLDTTEDYYLEKASGNIYLKNNKNLIHNYHNFKTEFVLNNKNIFCYASINNYKVLFNILKADDISFEKDQLSALYKIDQTEALGRYIYYNKAAFPIEYKIINTCDCFNNYYKVNSLWPNKQAGVKLIATFNESIISTILDDDPSEKISTIDGHEFTFIYFYDLIILMSYNKISAAM